MTFNTSPKMSGRELRRAGSGVGEPSLLAEAAAQLAAMTGRKIAVKVTINAGGRAVEIETSDTSVSAAEVADRALAVWRETADATMPSPGPGFGLMASERAEVAPTSTMRRVVSVSK